MKILFLGLMYDVNNESLYLKKSKIGLQTAINQFQWNMVNGLENWVGKDNLKIINVLPVGTFPKYYNSLLLRTSTWKHNNCSNNLEIGSVNIPFIKQKQREIGLVRNIKKWIEFTTDEKYIFIYSLYPPFLNSLRKIKLKYPNIKLILIVPDLPGKYGVLSQQWYKKIVQCHIEKESLDNLDIIDYFILLTDEMKKPLKIENRKYTVIEGFISNKELAKLQNNKELAKLQNNKELAKLQNNNRVILYTGTLKKEFGIDKLLDAFTMVEGKDIELWIAGSGEMENKILSMSENDPRIKFYGYVTHKESIELQQQATILINPRPNEGVYTKYSFPSKTIEYMLSGKPVLMYKLSGIPSEYDDYLYYIDENSVKGIFHSIIKLINTSQNELDKKANSAKDFILRNKNTQVQIKKIVNMLEIEK